ncbi:class II peroxidase [Zasmidium cellare ATCC 36951]|uniref:Peroxidase n=1 Tax=Zasmidium cellare ATCC 36951 TaxID=1080233 RepID=A0A6A6CJG2_ZASCE|nr:class II peroxidase [Zasmidium cellare ATCC 36951]KAF2166743.1 class II peroxidase [Zasmidium cellare ATCC 36951]
MFTRLSMLLFIAIIPTCLQFAQATQDANALVGLPRPDSTERTSPLDVDRLSSVLPIHDQNGSAPRSSKAIAELKSRAFGQQQRNRNCPAIWKTIAADLKLDFLGCNDHARSAVRFAFHDAAGYSSLNTLYGPASGGADGSLLLNDQEISRDANAPMKTFRDNLLLPKYNTYKSSGVGAADIVQFAGAIGVRSCPGGPRYKTVIGRTDDSNACPDGTLPAAFGANSSYSAIVQLFAQKGFNERDLAALLGAHSTSRAFAQQQNGIPSGRPQDSSPNVWDTAFYRQTQASQAPPGVYRFDSDVNVAQPETTCGKAFTDFGSSPPTDIGSAVWATAFADAMYRLSVLGISKDVVSGLVDCTSAVL